MFFLNRSFRLNHPLSKKSLKRFRFQKILKNKNKSVQSGFTSEIFSSHFCMFLLHSESTSAATISLPSSIHNLTSRSLPKISIPHWQQPKHCHIHSRKVTGTRIPTLGWVPGICPFRLFVWLCWLKCWARPWRWRGRPTSPSATGVYPWTLTFQLNSSANKPRRIPTGSHLPFAGCWSFRQISRLTA